MLVIGSIGIWPLPIWPVHAAEVDEDKGSQPLESSSKPAHSTQVAVNLDNNLDQLSEEDAALVEASPTLRRWLQQPPNLLEEIRNQPLIPMRLQASIGTDSWSVGLEDVRLFDRLTVSGDFQHRTDQYRTDQLGTDQLGTDQSGTTETQTYGSNLRYYLAPLGSQVNVSPLLGYRQLHQSDQGWGNLQLGAHAVFIPAPGAADLTVSYSWLTPTDSDQPTSTLAQVTTAYTITPDLRVGARYRYEGNRLDQDATFGLIVEWIP